MYVDQIFCGDHYDSKIHEDVLTCICQIFKNELLYLHRNTSFHEICFLGGKWK